MSKAIRGLLTIALSVGAIISTMYAAICPFGRRAKMERGYNQDHHIGDEIVRT